MGELDRLLEPGRFEDYCPNGLQVPGREEVATVATGVSAQLELFERAAAEGADLLLVHHGTFWNSEPLALDLAKKRRLKALFDADMSLAAYHLPLDAHPELGNNALLARALGAKSLDPFAEHRGQPIGFVATLGTDGEQGLAAPELFARVSAVTAREPLVFDSGPPNVQRVGIVSGGGSDYLGRRDRRRRAGVPHRRAHGAGNGAGAGGGCALHRRRSLRHRDPRREGAGRPSGREIRPPAPLRGRPQPDLSTEIRSGRKRSQRQIALAVVRTARYTYWLVALAKPSNALNPRVRSPETARESDRRSIRPQEDHRWRTI